MKTSTRCLSPRLRVPLLLAALGGVALTAAGNAAPGKSPPARVPLAEARRLVRMMDAIYQAGVLTTHRMYVQEPGVPAAVTWAKQVFPLVEAQGWPRARIFAATDRPLNPENQAREPFERDALQAFRQGKPQLERVDGELLRYATEIRVTEKSCLNCHVRNKEGDLLGGVSYQALIDLKRP